MRGTKKSVSFERVCYIREIPHINDLSEEVLKQQFLQPTAGRKSYYKDVLVAKEMSSENEETKFQEENNLFTIRGMEYWAKTDDGRRNLEKGMKSTVQEVLKEQAVQKSRNTYDEERLAEVSRKHSKQFQVLAYSTGLQDEMKAKQLQMAVSRCRSDVGKVKSDSSNTIQRNLTTIETTDGSDGDNAKTEDTHPKYLNIVPNIEREFFYTQFVLRALRRKGLLDPNLSRAATSSAKKIIATPTMDMSHKAPTTTAHTRNCASHSDCYKASSQPAWDDPHFQNRQLYI